MAKFRDPYDLAVQVTADVSREIHELKGKMPSKSEHSGSAANVQVAKLPSVNPMLIGRDDVLAKLDRAWLDPNTRLLSITAFGGVGKTAVAVNWWHNGGSPGAHRILGWSSYSQGARETSHTSAEPLLDYALRHWFRIEDPPKDSWERGELVAELVARERTLLILDGLEPLQFPPGSQYGSFKDRGLLALLKNLAAYNTGLCICTSRLPLTDLADYSCNGLVELDLSDLTSDSGALYLRKLGVAGEDFELKQASLDFGNHALALTLLGSLIKRYGGDIRRRDMIPSVFEAKQGDHARRIMREYEQLFRGRPELDILRVLGLFDRPADPGALNALRTHPFSIWATALENLAECRLLECDDPDGWVDCHPLVREHFSEEFRTANPEAFRKSNSQLYEYYSQLAPHQPDTLEAMTPLFHSVYHGCQAGRHQDAWSEIYVARLLRGETEFYLTQSLGAFGTSLALLANFFERRWTSPVPDLKRSDQLWLVGDAGFTLRALRRLADAGEPLQVSAGAFEQERDWENASLCFNNLSELHLLLGNISQALPNGRRAVALADASGVTLCKMGCRATLAHALHQAGRVEEAADIFDESWKIQAAESPSQPFLWGQPLFQYCDLLLDHGKSDEVIHVTKRSSVQSNTLLFKALDHLALVGPTRRVLRKHF